MGDPTCKYSVQVWDYVSVSSDMDTDARVGVN